MESHPYVLRTVGSRAEFIFENINLPFDDANNDGYVAFKIKTAPDLVLGDSFSNAANIFFDFNLPIATEPTVTTVSLLNTTDFASSDDFRIYPNPAGEILNIQPTGDTKPQSVAIYNALGQLVMMANATQQTKAIDVSALHSGNYFIRIQSEEGVSHIQFLKQ